MRKRRERKLWHMARKRWPEHMAYVMGFIHLRRKIERTGKVEMVGITLIFQDFLMWKPISSLTLTFGHTFQPLSASTARILLHCCIATY